MPPLLNIPFEFVVVDTLHLFLRSMGLLFHQVSPHYVSYKKMPLPYANPFLNTKWENKTLKKTQRIAEHKNSAIGRHFLEAHGNNNLLRESQFTVLRKCQSKFDCLVFEMLFIKKLKPNLNIQTDSIRAKLFVWYFLTLQFFNQLLLFFF